jgi:hypothetical protein
MCSQDSLICRVRFLIWNLVPSGRGAFHLVNHVILFTPISYTTLIVFQYFACSLCNQITEDRIALQSMVQFSLPILLLAVYAVGLQKRGLLLSPWCSLCDQDVYHMLMQYPSKLWVQTLSCKVVQWFEVYKPRYNPVMVVL